MPFFTVLRPDPPGEPPFLCDGCGKQFKVGERGIIQTGPIPPPPATNCYHEGCLP